MSEKPVIFISHASDDEELANLLKEQIEACFSHRIEAFVARYSIPAGEDWPPEIRANLKKAQAFVILVSPLSEKSRWVGIEIGYVWDRINRNGKGKLPVYPLCFPGSSVFSPLDGKQGKSLDSPDEVQEFFQTLCKQFPDGDPKRANIESIVKSVDSVNSSSYSEIDIKQKLKDYLRDEYKSDRWITYVDLDTDLGLQAGSAAKFLKVVADENKLIAKLETATGIKFNKPPLIVSVVSKRYA